MIFGVLDVMFMDMCFNYGILINDVGVEHHLICVLNIELSLILIELRVGN